MLTALATTALAAATLLPSNPLAPGQYLPASHRLELRLPVGAAAWMVGGMLGGAASFAIAGAELEASTGTFRGIGLLTGLAIGLAVGTVVGYLAKHRWVPARYATLALMALAVGGLAGETYRFVDGFQSGRYQVRVSWAGLLPPM